MIRQAQIRDIPQISEIITDCAEHSLMLHRSMEFLYEHVRDFHVYQQNDRVVGVCGLSIIWANLAEVYALAVASSQRGKGLGRQLVRAVVDDAQTLGVSTLMTLTYEQIFFEKSGFHTVDRMSLPMKVWSECARCPKHEACDEIAMIRQLEVPAIEIPSPGKPPQSLTLPILADDHHTSS